MNENMLIFEWFYNLPHWIGFDIFLSIVSFVLCFSAVFVPLYYLVTGKSVYKSVNKRMEDCLRAGRPLWKVKRLCRRHALCIFVFLVILFFVLRIIEKGLLDEVLSFNTVPYIREIACNWWVCSMEVHNPFPSFPSGHLFKCWVLWGVLWSLWEEKRVFYMGIACIAVMCIVRLYQTMHTPLDLILTAPLAVITYKAIVYCCRKLFMEKEEKIEG